MTERMRIPSFLLTLLLLGSSVRAGTPAPLAIEARDAEVRFLAVGHPSALKIRGTGKSLEGAFQLDEGKVSGKATFLLDSLSTGMGKRDQHMKEKYLEVPKFPKAELALTGIPTSEDFPFTGKLTLHGVEKPVTGKVKLTTRDGTQSVLAEFPLKLSEFGIAIPSFAGITVAEDVSVTVAFKVR